MRDAELWQAIARGVLPPRDPQTFPGKPLDEGRVFIDDEDRRRLSIPADVEVFQEDGRYVLRREPGPEPPRRSAAP